MQTPLFQSHCELSATMVNFMGWQLPMHYGSQIKEHLRVRELAGMFDVSHMGIVDIQGPGSVDLLRKIFANDVLKLKKTGQALYTCMLNEQGGVLDDLIVYRVEDSFFRVVFNAGSIEKDLMWLRQQAFGCEVVVLRREDLVILAVQGPKAVDLVDETLGAAGAIQSLKKFQGMSFADGWVARTGYTGEDGVELLWPAEAAPECWRRLLAAGVMPCGLGARDTLRLEAGLNLYGFEMDEHISPLLCNLAWTVDWRDESRQFIGKSALLAEQRRGIDIYLAGVIMREPGVLRSGMHVYQDSIEGVITSGTFSPSLDCSVALARLPCSMRGRAEVERRGKRIPVDIVKLPFVRQGKKLF